MTHLLERVECRNLPLLVCYAHYISLAVVFLLSTCISLYLVHKHLELNEFCLIGVYCPSLCLLTCLLFKSILSDIVVATPACFLGPCDFNIIFHTFHQGDGHP